MPDRYWVGGTGSWSNAAVHWAPTSGGIPDGQLPQPGDDMFVDPSSGSGPFIITVDIDTELLNNVSINYVDGCTIQINSNKMFQYAGALDQQNGSILLSANGIFTDQVGATGEINGTLGSSSAYVLRTEGLLTIKSSGTFVQPDGGTWYLNGDLTIESGASITHNDCEVRVEGAFDQTFDLAEDTFYRLNNVNYSSIVYFTGNDTELDGIYFNDGTDTRVDGPAVTLTGITPSLGSSKYHSKADLLEHDYIAEENGGEWIFNYDFQSAAGWNIIYGLNHEVENRDISDIIVEKGIDYLPSWAEIYLYDSSRSKISEYPRGCQITIYYFDGTEWQYFFSGFVLEINTSGRVGNITKLFCPGYDWFLRKPFTMDFTHRAHTILEMLEYIITFQTPFTWNASKIDLANGSNTAKLQFDGDLIIDAIIKILSYSDNEEFGIDLDREFFVQQRATSYDGTNDAYADISEGSFHLYDIDDDAKDGYNVIQLQYGPSASRRARYYWDDATLIDNWNDQLDLKPYPTKDDLVVEPFLSDESYALVEDYIQTLYDLKQPEDILKVHSPLFSFEANNPGEILRLTIGELGITAVEKKISNMRLSLKPWKVTHTLIDPANIIAVRQKRTLILESLRSSTKLQYTSQAFSLWDLLSCIFDTQADFTEFTLYSTGAVHADGYIYATGNTSGLVKVADVALLAGSVGTAAYPTALETNYSNYRRLMTLQYLLDQEGGSVEVRLKSAGGASTQVDEYEDIRGTYDQEDAAITLEIWMEWDGVTGISPKCNYVQLPWCVWPAN